MSSVETIHEPGDLIYTMSATGTVRVWVVDDDGIVRVAPAALFRERQGGS